MPRKKSILPPSIRVRENQRRSRARQKELIEDLNQRIREYEEKEIQATLSMQMAARRVSWENTQLRGLLVRNGLAREEIEEFLREQESIQTPSNATVIREELQSHTTTQLHIDKPIKAFGGASFTGQIPREPRGHEVKDHRSIRQFEGQDIPEAPSSEVDEEVLLNYFGQASPTTSSFAESSSMLEMSCETAASIISGMRGNLDRERARYQLGCEGGEHCNVKNIKVLQVMEMD